MDPHAVAVGMRAGLSADAAARLMLHDCWAKARDSELERFHWVNEDGILYAGELAEVAAVVWGDAVGEPEEQQEADL